MSRTARTFIVVAPAALAAFFAHRRLIAGAEAWAKPVSSLLGAVIGAIGLAFLSVQIQG